ncbi:hypothetical protein RQP46_010676 [Phenoliferia psychrophenolica]
MLPDTTISLDYNAQSDTLADLSDYLAPSQLCIKPVTLIEDTEPDASTPVGPGLSKTEIVIDSEHGYYEVGTAGIKGKKLKKAEITLNDCLACSGCITSAESVLVSMQSHEEVYRVLTEQPDLTPILSIAPQSVASLAALHNLSPSTTMRGLRVFFKEHLGFRLVFDTTFARTLSLSENRLEFLERRSTALASPSTRTSSPTPLPILSSSCPGWICYAEKTHGELLPFVSAVKSAQAVMGTLVKAGPVAKRLGLRPEQIYHVTVMPCYDKKLEASRPDFTTTYTPSSPSPSSSSTEPLSVRDVDCVLTTGEVQRMLDDKGLSLATLARSSPPPSSSSTEEDTFFPSSVHAPGTSSGGYLFNTIQASLPLSPSDLYRTRLITTPVRSEDYISYTLSLSPLPSSSPSTEPPTTLLLAAKCYGFRNLQNVVRKIAKEADLVVSRGAAGKLPPAAAAAMAARRRKASTKAGGEVDQKLDFVEVMACPSGCVNGGGQIAPPTEKTKRVRVDEEGMPDVGERMEVDGGGGEEERKLVAGGEGDKVLSAKDWVAKVERVYWDMDDDLNKTVVRPEAIDWERVDESIRPFLEARTRDAESPLPAMVCTSRARGVVKIGGVGKLRSRPSEDVRPVATADLASARKRLRLDQITKYRVPSPTLSPPPRKMSEKDIEFLKFQEYLKEAASDQKVRPLVVLPVPMSLSEQEVVNILC